MAQRDGNERAGDAGTSPHGAADYFPARPSLQAARRAAAGCRGCGLHRRATQTVVKHFKWEPRGKRRLHKRPLPSEIGACLPWLRMEIELVRPNVIVCLGATAAQALLGKGFSVTRVSLRISRS